MSPFTLAQRASCAARAALIAALLACPVTSTARAATPVSAQSTAAAAATAPATAPAADAVALFNGKDLTGWKMAGPGKFEVVDGELRSVGGMGLLWHEKELGDYTLSLEFKVSREQDNAGVFVRFPDPGNDPGVAIREGYEVQIQDSGGNNRTGAIYNAKNSTELASRPAGEWNRYEITVAGQKITVRLNDKVVNEFTGEKKTPRGFVGLQNHDEKSKVSFRNVKVAEAKPSAALPAPGPIDPARLPGLVGQYYKDVKGYADIAKASRPFLSRVDNQLAFRAVKGQFYKTKLSTNFGGVWTGYLRVDKPGDYVLSLRSDDGSRLFVGDALLIDKEVKGAQDAMKDKTAKVTLAAGDYPIRVEYFNLGGGAGVQLGWRRDTPEEKLANVPAAQLVHDAQQEKVEWDQTAWNKANWSYRQWAQQYGEAWDKMDYGPFVSHTVEFEKDNVALKGITLHLGDNDDASITFDTDLVRFAGGWTGGFLELKGVVFDGSHGSNPAPDGEMVFLSPQLPGAIAGEPSDKLTRDPRPRPYGPIPRDWAKYKALHLNGKRAVLHYTVGGADVYDAPWAETVGNDVVLTRTIRLAASPEPLTMLLDRPAADEPARVKADGAQVRTIGGNRYLVFPPRQQATTYRVAIARGGSEKVDAALAAAAARRDDMDALLKPGPARWTKPVATKGEVSRSTTQPYVLDTLTAPEENPYHSWLRFGGMDFFADGKRAALSTWSGDVWIVSGIDDKLENLQWKRFATGLFQPLGLRIVDDTVHVLGRDQITRFRDANGDGEADVYENFNNDCEVSRSFHEFSFDLQTDPQGNFYYTKAGPVRPGGRGWEEITAHNGTILRVSRDGSKLETFATGVRAPNGMGVGPNGEITTGDNEGTWTPQCRINMVRQGAMLGVPDLAKQDPAPKDYDKPICWLPHGDVDNSSGGQAWAPPGERWGPFGGRLLHTSYGTCSLFLVMYEHVDSQIQGGVVKFANLPFITGICRPRFNPGDGQLYIAGLRGWQTTAARDAGFQRVRYTGAKVNMPTQLHVKPDGIELSFTAPLDAASAADPSNYAVEQWNLLWSSAYGSDHYSVAEPKEKAHDAVEVEKVTLSADRKSVFLKLEEVVPVMQMKIQMKLKSADGAAMDFSIYNTINQVPKKPAPPATAAAARE